ncbi:MAG: PD-(D/E)XK nuclease family protein [Desulfovibrionaceae bacterium]|jgi:hypothetical protein|nr:PD-(D/E)XK nuclease family protein [Desulfovibrionaceae bacterium]
MRAVTVVPWERDFLAALKEIVLAERGDDLAATTIVFPHRRPARYLLDIFRHDAALPRPLLLPEMTSIPDFVNRLRLDLSDVPFTEATVLDQVGLLYEVARGLKLEGRGALARLPLAPQRFFPWGVRLARLLDDMLRQNVAPTDIRDMEGDVEPFAAALLEQLGAVFERFTTALEERGWTTPGFAAYWAPQWLDGIAAGLAGRAVYFAGFYALTGTEDALLRALWERCGARMILHGDRALADPAAAPHWSCAEHRRMLDRWRARAELFVPACETGDVPTCPGPTPIRFIEGYDLHSQLDALARELADLRPPAAPETPETDADEPAPAPAAAHGQARAAVVLPDTAMLLPVLHHLPVKDVNVSMGYPLSRTTLHRLLETLLRLQETRPPEPDAHPGGSATARPAAPGRTYYWRELIDCIRHPYLKMLDLDGAQPLRIAFHALERVVRTGEKFTDPRALAAALADEELEAGATGAAGAAETGTATGRSPTADAETPPAPEAVRALLEEVFAACLDAFAPVRTLAQLADALDGLCDLLLRHGGTLWTRFPLDAECLYRLLHETIPALRQCTLADEEFPRAVLFSILREFLDTERVPFEAEPLAGLQVLGMLETRLLRFGRVYVVNAVDDLLPGAPSHDPLLPDALRALLGLPDNRMRDLVAAFNFHRLIRGADEVVILYQSGTGGEGPDARAVRSRFVEELLWEREKPAGRVFKAGEGPLETVSYPITPIRRERPGTRKTPAVAARLENFLDRRPLSAKALDAFLTCPHRFFLETLCGLRPVEEVGEEGDPAQFGNVVHEVLREFFRPHLGMELARETLSADALADALERAVAADSFFRQLPFDQRTLLLAAGRRQMAKLLAEMPEHTTVLLLEEELTADLPTPTRTFRLQGVLDRVDRRTGGAGGAGGAENGNDGGFGDVIVDYKTGALKSVKPDLWTDADLWSMIRARPEGPELADVLALVAERAASVQMPLYLHLYAQAAHAAPRDAALVELKDSCKEVPLLAALDAPTRALVLTERIPALLAFLCESLVRCDAFPARPGRHCDWCPLRAGC